MAILMIDWPTTAMTVCTLQGAMHIDFKCLALAEHHAINGDIRKI
jgi:hypothetical protein